MKETFEARINPFLKIAYLYMLDIFRIASGPYISSEFAVICHLHIFLEHRIFDFHIAN